MKHLTQWWQVAGASKGRIPLPTLDKRGHVRGKVMAIVRHRWCSREWRRVRMP